MTDEDIADDLKEQKILANKEADKHRKLRDKYNNETREWAIKRDEYNRKVKEAIEQTKILRQKRDALNSQVKEEKKIRVQLNEELNAAAENLKKIKMEMLPQKRPTIKTMKVQLNKLEFKMMTTVLTPTKEKEMIDEIKRINKQIEEQEAVLNKNNEYKRLKEIFLEIKDKAEAKHKEVSKLANEAQEAHEKMLELYENIENNKQLADEAQEKFIEAKKRSDEEHHAHIEWIKKVRDIEKLIAGEKRKRAKFIQEKAAQESEEEMSDIISKLKKGKKLSTEDLFSLQKMRFNE